MRHHSDPPATHASVLECGSPLPLSTHADRHPLEFTLSSGFLLSAKVRARTATKPSAKLLDATRR